ncbi:MAG: hypothetical protein IJA72_00255 [Clostridia bacterium]|nr:hypothetical protein [Clostridia bacterium]
MRFIEKIKKDLELRKEEKEVRKEERLIIREMAQERIAKKRYEEKKKQFDEMLDMTLPCERIIRLKNENGEIHYFQMGGNDIEGISFSLGDEGNVPMPSKLKQLTGANSGEIQDINPPSGYSNGLYTCEFNGFRMWAIETSHINCYKEKNYFQKRYGNTLTLRQLLLR